MFDSLSDRLNDTFDRLRGKGKLTEADITSAMRDIRMALLEADVNFKVVKEFVAKTKERCMTAEVMESLSPAQNVVKIVLDELTEMLGSTESKLVFSNRIPNVIMLVGLQGSGKTTAAVKLAYLLKKQGRSPLLAACDVYRPAAITQLQFCDIYARYADEGYTDLVYLSINAGGSSTYNNAVKAMELLEEERPGYTMSERTVGKTFDRLFAGCKQRIIVTTFASNVHRIQQVIDAAAAVGRKVAVTGRSMENILKVATELDYLHLPENTLVDLNQIKSIPKDKLVIVSTGSQGEDMSALYRMAFSSHRQVEIQPGDHIIISASAIPGNEKSISRIINELYRKGAEVIYDKLEGLHVSGHACQEELKIIHALTKPKFFIPVHGEQRHLQKHAALARQMGMNPKNILIADTGSVIECTPKTCKLAGTVPAGKILVDGTGVGDVGSVVLRDRKHLAQDGMIVVCVNLSSEDGSVLSGPDIISRGFVYMKDNEDLMDAMKMIATHSLEVCHNRNISDWATIKSTIKGDLSQFLFKNTKRNPMILPVIMEI